jgi:hypothetical protein
MPDVMTRLTANDAARYLGRFLPALSFFWGTWSGQPEQVRRQGNHRVSECGGTMRKGAALPGWATSRHPMRN